MNPGPPPLPHHYHSPVQHEFMALPPGLTRKIRSTSTLVGSLSILLSLVLGLLIATVGYQLPTSTASTTIIVVGMGVLSAFFYLFSGITLTTSRSYLKTGHLNLTFARQGRRLLATFWFGTFLVTLVSVFFFTGAVHASSHLAHGRQVDYSSLSITGYLVLLGLPFVLSAINFFVGRRLLRPAPGLLRNYSADQHHTPFRPE